MALKNPTIDRDYSQGIGVSVGNTLLLDSNASSIYKRLVMKKTISKK